MKRLVLPLAVMISGGTAFSQSTLINGASDYLFTSGGSLTNELSEALALSASTTLPGISPTSSGVFPIESGTLISQSNPTPVNPEAAPEIVSASLFLIPEAITGSNPASPSKPIQPGPPLQPIGIAGTNPVPEPSAVALGGIGLGLLAFYSRARKSRA